MINYSCPIELFATIEAALAAHAYRVELPLQFDADGVGAMVMTQGVSSVHFRYDPMRESLELQIWGADQSQTVRLLESLPIRWAKQRLIELGGRHSR